MKWITIDKARPKFGLMYLVTDIEEPGYVETGNLLRSETTETGVKHVFKTSTREIEPTHIAAVTLPEKEVDNG